MSVGNEQGSGIITVMVAAVVMALVATNFAQKMTGKAMVGRATEIMAFQDILLEYYSTVAANRATYKCNIAKNGAPSSSTFTKFDLYDMGSPGNDCSTSAEKIVPSAGRDMELGDDITSTNPNRPCAKNNGFYLCVQAEWRKTGNDVEIKISVEFDVDDTASGISMPLRTREKSVYFNESKGGRKVVGMSCDVTKPNDTTKYEGDKPIIAITSEKNKPSDQVTCGSWPLVIPVVPPRTYPDVDAICPPISGGETGIMNINTTTGKPTCNSNFILFKSDTGTACSGEINAITSIDKGGSVDKCSETNSPKRIGVKPVSCGSDKAITGWDTSGNAKSCSNKVIKGNPGKKGIDFVTVNYKYRVCNSGGARCDSDGDCNDTCTDYGRCATSNSLCQSDNWCSSGTCSSGSTTTCHGDTDCDEGNCSNTTSKDCHYDSQCPTGETCIGAASCSGNESCNKSSVTYRCSINSSISCTSSSDHGSCQKCTAAGSTCKTCYYLSR